MIANCPNLAEECKIDLISEIAMIIFIRCSLLLQKECVQQDLDTLLSRIYFLVSVMPIAVTRRVCVVEVLVNKRVRTAP